MSIDWQRPEYQASQPGWEKIRNVTDAEEVEQYLRTLNPADNSVDNATRNEQYRDNAIFYAIAGYTARGLTATPFRKDPSFSPPPALEYLKQNADGAGNGINQLAKTSLAEDVRFGRGGLYVGFPPGTGTESKADDGDRFATIHSVQPESIINWRTRTVGAKTVLDLVVIQTVEQRADGYELVDVDVIRELALDAEGYYFDRKWERADSASDWTPGEAMYPLDASGSRLREIPFTFIGSENNDSTVDLPPMKDLVAVNIGHYRNSADYEDSVFYAGQAQPWLSGADKGHLEAMEESGFYIGSRYLMPVPPGGQFGFASADPNPMVLGAMQEKVQLMIGLGARFIEAGGVAKTAMEAEGDNAVQHSVLSLIVANVSSAYTRALTWVCLFMGVAEEVTYEINQDFTRANASPEELAQIIAGWTAGVIPSADVWAFFQRHGYIDPGKTLEEIDQELQGTESPAL